VNDPTLPAILAVLLGVALAAVGFAPFVAVNYRRYGRLTIRHTLTWLAFTVYFLAIWTYTLLPLPDQSIVRCAHPQLQPFYFVADLFKYPVDSVGALLRNPVVLQTGLNVVLFLPLGFFLRALFGKGVGWTVLAGAALSLFVEVTQLTGVWGLYPCAYRLFDVDDLISNTFGALLGGVIALAAPRRWVSARPLQIGQPTPVTVGRRLTAMAVDLVFIWLVTAAVAIAAQLWQTMVLDLEASQADGALSGDLGIAASFALQAVCVLASGRTVGDWATELRLQPTRPALLGRRLVRLAAGIGGYQMLGLLPGVWANLQYVFALVAVIAVAAAPKARSLPGLIARQTLADAREVAGAAPSQTTGS
jgi:glycopeptide antibiotics resistance protein